MQMYNKSLYPTDYRFKYQSWEKNSEVSAHLYQVNSGKTIHLDLAGLKLLYSTSFSTAKNDESSNCHFNRHQNKVEILKLILLLEPFLNY